MNLRPEARLLLACVALGQGSPELASIAALAQPDLDWPRFARMARLHAVLPLVYHRLAQAGVERPELRPHATELACRSLRLTVELVALSQEFEAQGIPMLAWKGPALAMLAWGDVSLRQFGDLDLIVFPEDYERASVLLTGRGYRPDATYDAKQTRVLLRHGYNATFRHESAGHRVELHWRFSRGSSHGRLSSRRAWTERQNVEVGTGHVASPGPEDLLLSLVDHGARHAWERLGWIVDIGRLTGDPRLEWEGLLARARQIGFERMLLLAVVLADRLLGSGVPAPAMRRCPSHLPLTRLEAWVTSRLLREAGPHGNVAEYRVFQLRTRERWGDRAFMLGDMLLGIGPGDWKAVGLREEVQGLYYLLRPFRVAWQYGMKFLSAMVQR